MILVIFLDKFTFDKFFKSIPSKSFKKLFPAQPSICHSPFTFVNFFSSNNCNLKLVCTFGEATTMILWF